MTDPEASFALDARLSTSTVTVGDLPLCRLLLRNDSRFLWALLVPRRPGCVELADLDPVDRGILMEEVVRLGNALREQTACDKLNVGAIGNLVPQLHIHVVARTVRDPAWPDTVWNRGEAISYEPAELAAKVSALCQALGLGAA